MCFTGCRYPVVYRVASWKIMVSYCRSRLMSPPETFPTLPPVMGGFALAVYLCITTRYKPADRNGKRIDSHWPVYHTIRLLIRGIEGMMLSVLLMNTFASD